MAIYTMEIATDFNYPNITVYRKYRDGVHYAWRFVSNEGYVMYDTTAEDSKPMDDGNGDYLYDEEGNFIEVPCIYYYTNVDCPLSYNWDNFSWVAVPRDSVPAEDIFGVDKPNHEIM